MQSITYSRNTASDLFEVVWAKLERHEFLSSCDDLLLHVPVVDFPVVDPILSQRVSWKLLMRLSPPDALEETPKIYLTLNSPSGIVSGGGR